MSTSEFRVLRDLLAPADSRIILMVMDGLGGLPTKPRGATELESANTPNFDALANDGISGLQRLPTLRELGPDVLIVTGDHSTPAAMKSHSWHPVPTVLWAKNVRPDTVATFGERVCIAGGLGSRFAATDLMPLALAHAGRLRKFGA